MAERRVDAFDAFELRLARDLRELSAPAVVAVDAPNLAATLAATHPPRQGRLAWPRLDGRLVVLVAAAALLAAGAIAAGLARPTLPQPLAHLGHLAYAQDNEIWIADGDGTDPIRLTDAVKRGRQASNPQWHGTTLTFVEDPGSGGSQWLAVVRAAAEPPTYVELPTPGGVQPDVAVSADARRYALLTQPRLVIGDLAGGTAISVPPPDGYEAWDNSDLETLSWDPSGQSLLVGACDRAAVCGKSGGQPSIHDLFRVRLDGTVASRLSTADQPAYRAVLSPTGDRIAFYSCHLKPGMTGPGGCDDRGWGISVMDAAGTARRVIDETTLKEGWGSDIYVAFSPDGSRIAYSYSRGDLDASVFVADVSATTPPIKIAASGVPTAWSPDGQRVLVSWPGLSAAAADGSGSTPLVDPQLATSFGMADWEWVPDGAPDPFATPRG